MKITKLKEAIDAHHSKMSAQLYERVWEPIDEISEETTYVDMGYKYLQTFSYYTGWLARVSMLKVLDFLTMEPEPVEYLKEFWKTTENKDLINGQPRDLTLQELYDLYTDFYCRKPSEKFSIEFHFRDLRRAISDELGGAAGILELETMRRNAGELNFEAFCNYYTLKTITNPHHFNRDTRPEPVPAQMQPQPQSTHQYLQETLLSGSYLQLSDAQVDTNRPAPQRSTPQTPAVHNWLDLSAIQVHGGESTEVAEPDNKRSLLGNMH
jgi:hypothetical protein